MSARTRRIAAAGAWLVAALCAQEILLRLVFPLPEIRSLNRADYMRGATADPLPRLRSLRIVWESAPDGARFEHGLNAYGFRDREWRLARERGRERVLIVGDSFVEGTMAGDDETIARAFERSAARAGRRVEAMNLGVMGADLPQAFQLTDDAVPLFAPDAVLLVLFSNDLPPPAFDVVRVPPERFDGRLPRLAVVAAMLARGEIPPMRFRLRAVPYHSPASEPQHPWHGREAEVRARMREDLAQAVLDGRMNPHRVGGASRLEQSLREPIELADPLRFLARTVARHGARLFVAYLPDRNQLTRHYARFEAALGAGSIDLTGPAYQRHRRELARDCRAARVPLLDLAPELRRQEAAGSHLYWDYDDHMRAAGYARVGEALFEWWARVGSGRAGHS